MLCDDIKLKIENRDFDFQIELFYSVSNGTTNKKMLFFSKDGIFFFVICKKKRKFAFPLKYVQTVLCVAN